MRAAVGVWAANEVARRWKSLVALGVLGGLVGGLALAAVAGARRTETAYDRFREATGRSDAIVFSSQVGVRFPDFRGVRALPEVEDAGEFVFAPIGLKEFPGSGTLAPGDDRLYRTINRPLVVSGRLPDPNRSDEILVNRHVARELGVKVGDRFTLVSALEFPEQEDAIVEGGPSVQATVVGIGDSFMDLVFFGDGPGFIPSIGFLAQHPEVPRGSGNLVVRLRPGTDVTAFRQRAADVMGLPNLPVRDQAQDTKRFTHGTDLERTALLLFAAAVALAGVVLVGQALARTVYTMAEPASALRALGFTRNGLVAGLVIPVSIAAAAGAVTAIGVAVAVSRWFPVGLAGRLEPDPGVHADWVVIIPGVALVALITMTGATIAASRATSPSRGRLGLATRLSPLAALRRVAPLPAVIGAGLALSRGDGERALPVRPALASGVAAVLGVVGAFGLLHGIDDALANPDRSGQFWDADVALGDEAPPMAEVVATVESDEQITDVVALRLIDREFEGVSLPVYAIEPVKGSRSFTLLEGRKPVGDEEVVIGPATAKALDREIGDTIGVGGGTEGRQVRVVGLGLLPQTPHFSFDQGVWMSVEGFDAIAPDSEDDEAREDTILVRFAAGQSVDAGTARLEERLGPVEIEPRALPQDVTFLRNVRTLPKALAAFLVVLGLGALGHVLASAVRRRRHDLAVLRALGFRPLQVAACIAWQAATVSLVALVVGIPLGIAAGRWSWRWVADSTPLLYVPPLAATVVLVCIPVALVLANATAALPARRAARLRPADVLRAE